MSKSIVAALALAALLSASEARAQLVPGTYGPSATAGVVVTAPGTTLPVRTYSYYAAYPHPARGYFGYGSQDIFPYYGRPYGHPYDPWTWPYMTGSYHGSMVRYYDPPVK